MRCRAGGAYGGAQRLHPRCRARVRGREGAPDRLRLAESIGADAVDISKGDPVEQITEENGANGELPKEGRIPWQYGQFFTRGQRMGTGQCPVKGYNRERRDLIIAGHARPSFIVSHELPLDEAPIGYDKFDKREGGWTKVLLHPAA